ncbi:MAG: hypothetical protein HND47_11645 [Chloroflexi bacterium]|nr:hypothetical protein [Chloroflexota bacterium]
MSTIFFHVGPHKTGSTYLQDTFARQAMSLENQGVLYPSIGREYSTGHHNIAWFFEERPHINTNRAKLSGDLLRLEAEESKNVLLSSEEFSRLLDAQTENLKAAFPNWDFHTIYFLRKGSSLIVSLWQESIKNGLITTPLDKTTLSIISDNMKYDPFNHDANIAKFKRRLEGEVSVLNYNELLASRTDLTQPVSEIINADLKQEHKRINPSLGMEVAELVRAANLYNARIGKRRRGFPRIACHRMLKIPILNSILKNHLNAKFAALHKSLPAKYFLEMGFQSSHFLDGDAETIYNYIPESVLLDELNRDNILPWRMIKKMIQEK